MLSRISVERHRPLSVSPECQQGRDCVCVSPMAQILSVASMFPRLPSKLARGGMEDSAGGASLVEPFEPFEPFEAALREALGGRGVRRSTYKPEPALDAFEWWCSSGGTRHAPLGPLGPLGPRSLPPARHRCQPGSAAGAGALGACHVPGGGWLADPSLPCRSREAAEMEEPRERPIGIGRLIMRRRASVARRRVRALRSWRHRSEAERHARGVS